MSQFQPDRFAQLLRQSIENGLVEPSQISSILSQSGMAMAATTTDHVSRQIHDQITQRASTGETCPDIVDEIVRQVRDVLTNQPTSAIDSEILCESRQIGRYRLIEFLGAGGMGEVWRAEADDLDDSVVVKFLPKELRKNAIEIRRLQKCFQHVRNLDHPNVCPVFELETDAEIGLFLVMRFAPGVTLADYRITQGDEGARLPIDAVVQILRPVAAALDYSHRQNVVHLDIKPANIMVDDESGNVQLVDFGLSEEIRQSMTNISLSTPGAAGTWIYMAPERWRGQVPTGKADQYSLGVVAYELLTGRPPFQSGDPAVLRMCVLNEPVPGMPGHDNLNSSIARALARDSGSRFDSCSDFIDALTKPDAVEPSTETETSGDQTIAAKVLSHWSDFTPRSRSTVAVLVAIAALVFLSTILYQRFGSSNGKIASAQTNKTGTVALDVESSPDTNSSDNLTSPSSGSPSATAGGTTTQSPTNAPGIDAATAKENGDPQPGQMQPTPSLESQQQDRLAKMKRVEEAKSKSQTAYELAKSSGGDKRFPVEFAKALEMVASAKSAFESEDWDKAINAYRDAQLEFDHLNDMMIAVDRNEAEKATFEAEKLRLGAPLLTSHGGKDWAAVQRLLDGMADLDIDVRTKRYQEATALLRRSEPEIRLRHAKSLIAAGQREPARDILVALKKSHPTHAEASRVRDELDSQMAFDDLFSKGKYADALEMAWDSGQGIDGEMNPQVLVAARNAPEWWLSRTERLMGDLEPLDQTLLWCECAEVRTLLKQPQAAKQAWDEAMKAIRLINSDEGRNFKKFDGYFSIALSQMTSGFKSEALQTLRNNAYFSLKTFNTKRVPREPQEQGRLRTLQLMSRFVEFMQIDITLSKDMSRLNIYLGEAVKLTSPVCPFGYNDFDSYGKGMRKNFMEGMLYCNVGDPEAGLRVLRSKVGTYNGFPIDDYYGPQAAQVVFYGAAAAQALGKMTENTVERYALDAEAKVPRQDKSPLLYDWSQKMMSRSRALQRQWALAENLMNLIKDPTLKAEAVSNLIDQLRRTRESLPDALRLLNDAPAVENLGTICCLIADAKVQLEGDLSQKHLLQLRGEIDTVRKAGAFVGVAMGLANIR